MLLAFLPLKFTQPNPEVLDQVLPLDGASTLEVLNVAIVIAMFALEQAAIVPVYIILRST